MNFLMNTKLAMYIRAQIMRHAELCRYIVIGVMNTLVNAAVYNALIFSTGIAQGKAIILFSLIAFVVTVINAFFWNKFWVFKGNQGKAHKQFAVFWIVTTCTALLNAGIIHVIVNTIGAPVGISPKVWANVALAVTIPVAFICNFFGIKLFVFGGRLWTRND